MTAMRKEYANLRRRPFFTPVWLLALAALMALAGAAWAVRAASTTIVVITRHAEKADETAADPPLSAAGIERAERLAALLGSRPELSVDAVFITQWRRTGATAEPLAARLRVPVITVPSDDLEALESRILRDFRGQRVLVIAHSDTVPARVRDLSQGASVPAIEAREYGAIYIVAIPRWSRPSVLAMTLP